ncbi:MAG: hypothetical protein NZU63_06885 [Gemmataceae bacterium]|nr:hypothetical protein [Gemmataceae bacterium]MDW8242546.1 hypothetical protein [Thermogemmata sp.]
MARGPLASTQGQGMSASVLLLYNQPILPPDHPEFAAERDVLDTVAECQAVLKEAGFVVQTLGIAHDPQPLLETVRHYRPDVVFNLHEGVPGCSASEITATALLEWLNVPFTGCSSLALALGRDKVRSKYLLCGAGLPTPAFAVVEHGATPSWSGPFPVIVKPASQDASVGIEQANVVVCPTQLPGCVERLRQQFGAPVLIEQLLAGREFHVNVIEIGPPQQRELLVLPPGEIVYRPGEPHWHPIYTYTAKWLVHSGEYQRCEVQAPVLLSAQLQEQIDQLARRAFRLFDCRDYARLDIRLDQDQRPYILEINPNPYLISLILVNALEAIGRSFAWLVVELVQAALARGSGPRSRSLHQTYT